MLSQAATNGAFAADILYALWRGGVREVVVAPGARSAPLAFAAHRQAGLRLHVCVDERAGAFFALGLARGSGRPTVFLCTSGSAPAHALPAMLEARHDRVPLIVVSADRPAELHDCGTNQTLAQGNLFADAAPTVTLEAPVAGAIWPELPGRLAHLLDAATHPAGKPMHLNVRLREPLYAAPAAPGRHDHPESESPRKVDILRSEPDPSRSLVDALLSRLAGRRGVIVAGAHPPDGELGGAVHRLAAVLGWPVVAEPSSQAALGFARPTLIGRAAAFLRSVETGRLLAPEVVLRIGRAPTSRAVSTWLRREATGRVIVLDAAAAQSDPEHAAAAFAIAPVAATLLALAERQPTSAPADWLDQWQRAETAARRYLDDAALTAFWEGSVVRAVIGHAPEGDALHLGNSTPIRDAELFAAYAGQARTIFTSRGTSGIDGGIATVVGEALGNRRPVVAILGDLAFLHDAGGLLAARPLWSDAGAPSPVTLVVVDNGGGGIFRALPLAEAGAAFARTCLTPTNVPVADLCAAAGFSYVACTDLVGLQAALTQRRGLTVIHARVDGEDSHNRRQRVLAECEAATLAALSHPSDSLPLSPS